MKSTSKDITIATDQTIDAIAQIKFFIRRFLETKDLQCLKMAKEETILAKKKAIDVLTNEENDKNLKIKMDAEDAFAPLLETLNSIEQLLDEYLKRRTK